MENNSCKTCGTELNNNDTACPKCTAKSQGNKSALSKDIGVLPWVALCMIVFGFKSAFFDDNDPRKALGLVWALGGILLLVARIYSIMKTQPEVVEVKTRAIPSRG